MLFDYFYGVEAEQYNFIRLPKLLMTQKEYCDISLESKLLYGLDRMSGEYGGPDLTRYQAVFDGTVSTNSLDGIWEAFCRRSLGSDGQPLAISDLVELYDDSGSEFYYVDRTAIVPVQLKAPEQESGMTMTL